MSFRKIESKCTKRRKIREEIKVVKELLSHSNSLEYEPPENVFEINNLNCTSLFDNDNSATSNHYKDHYNISSNISNNSTNLPLSDTNTSH